MNSKFETVYVPYFEKDGFYIIWTYQNPEKVTVLENLQNSWEFPL